jgi:hypothetical protein
MLRAIITGHRIAEFLHQFIQRGVLSGKSGFYNRKFFLASTETQFFAPRSHSKIIWCAASI